MGYCFAIKLCLCIFFALSIVSTARIGFSFSGNERDGGERKIIDDGEHQ
ncbi:hypothetical protein HID58_079243 [Brassica napus]|uniref:Uncharacterized protein n=1 Tax=Brassica napus TaxID=3708 RepID=A0ABQ7Y355_BRANA|nr:hypothetical protein HID58_079243 [Brassica napus]